MKAHELDWLLPDFPRIAHLRQAVNTPADDVLASSDELNKLMAASGIYIEEKIDGANCGMAFTPEGEAAIRNRTHILNKAYTQTKLTPAKQQFVSAWQWLYAHRLNFKTLWSFCGSYVSVYGEWVLVQHGVVYDKLPAKFIAYAIYDPDRKDFLPPHRTRSFLRDAGFQRAPLVYSGKPMPLEQLLSEGSGASGFSSTSQREGVVIKTTGENHWFKVLNPDYVQNSTWNNKVMVKQPSWRTE